MAMSSSSLSLSSVALDTANSLLIDMNELMREGDTVTLKACRDELICHVMDESQRLAKAFSKADFPGCPKHIKDDYNMAEAEYQALINRVVYLPESVEGVRFLEKWLTARLDTMRQIEQASTGGNTIALRPTTQPELHEDIKLNDDMAKGLRLGMMLARSMLEPFPLAVTVNETENDDA